MRIFILFYFLNCLFVINVKADSLYVITHDTLRVKFSKEIVTYINLNYYCYENHLSKDTFNVRIAYYLTKNKLSDNNNFRLNIVSKMTSSDTIDLDIRFRCAHIMIDEFDFINFGFCSDFAVLYNSKSTMNVKILPLMDSISKHSKIGLVGDTINFITQSYGRISFLELRSVNFLSLPEQKFSIDSLYWRDLKTRIYGKKSTFCINNLLFYEYFDLNSENKKEFLNSLKRIQFKSYTPPHSNSTFENTVEFSEVKGAIKRRRVKNF